MYSESSFNDDSEYVIKDLMSSTEKQIYPLKSKIPYSGLLETTNGVPYHVTKYKGHSNWKTVQNIRKYDVES